MQAQRGEQNGDQSAEGAEAAAAAAGAAVDLGPSNESNRPKQAKTVYFHRDGVAFKQPIRVAIHPNRYRGFDALLTELTDRMPELSYGVRAVFTPRGRDRVSSLEDFDNQGHYLCSTRQKRAAAPVDPNKPIVQPAWRATGKLTGGIAAATPDQTLTSATAGLAPLTAAQQQRRATRAHQPRREVNSYPNSDTAAGASGDDLTGPAAYAPMFKRADCKRIYVRQNGEPFKKHIVLLNKRMVQSFEQVLDDLSAIFRMQVRKIYTIDGQLVESLSAMYNGPESYVVAGQEKFKPIFAWGSADQVQQAAGAEGVGGGRRKLPPIGRRAKEMRLANAGKSKGMWRVKISTPAGEESNGTSSHVYLTVYGRDGQSDPIPLSLPVKSDGEPINPFKAGQEDEFEISTGSIGQVTKVRLSHDSSGASPGWMAGRLIMTSEGVGQGETLVFEFNRWLARDRDDGDTSRELPAVRDGRPVLPMERYRIEVHTGDCYNAGTQSEVYIQLFGQQGDTGRRVLLKPVSNVNGTASAEAPFQKGQIDVFELESVSLGPLRKVLIGHNGKGPGHGWFLDKVIVYELSAPSEGHAFLCNRWLDEGEDDGRISRELKLRDTFMQDLLERELWDYISWAFAGGNVIQLYSKVTEKPLRINSGDISVDAKAEEKDPMSYFTVQARKADVRLFRSTAAPKCYLAIDNGLILGQGKGGALCEFRVRIQPDRSVVLESSRHSLQQINIGADGEPVDPRHWKGASTGPGKLFVPYCKGMLRHRGIVLFSTSLTQTLSVDHDNGVHGTGKRNRMSHFRVHKVEGDSGVRQFESVVFAEQFLRIKDGQCDCKGTGDIYCYFKVEKYKDKGFVTLECLGAKGLFIGFAPDGRVIATEDHGESNVRLVPEVIQFGQSKNLDPSAAIEAANSARQEEKSSAPPEPAPEPAAVEAAADEGTSATTEATDSPDTWRLLLDTEEACVGGRLTLFAYGDAGMVGPIAVAAAGEGALAAASQDEFQVSLPGTGALYKLRLQLSPLVESAAPSAVWSVSRVQLTQSGKPADKSFDASFVDSGSKRLVVNGDGDLIDSSCLELATRPDLGLVEYRLDLGTDVGQEVGYVGRIGVCLVGDRGDSGRRSFSGLRLTTGETLALKLHAVDLGRLVRCHVSVDLDASADEAASPWHCGQVVVSAGGANGVQFSTNQHQPELRRSQGKLDYILRPIDMEQAVNELVTEAISSALKEINSDAEQKLREDEEPELAHLAEDPSEEPTVTEEDSIDLLAKEAKFLVDDIAEQVAKRMEGLREGDQAAAKPGEHDWHLTVSTGSTGCSPDCELFIQVYGLTGKSDNIRLKSVQQHLRLHPDCDADLPFKLKAAELGQLYKLRISASDDRDENEWFVKQVSLEHRSAPFEKFHCPVGEWFGRCREPLHEVSHELPLLQDLEVLSYTVEIENAHTVPSPASRPYVQLLGSRGDSGHRRLHRQSNDAQTSSPLTPDAVDAFRIDCVDLDRLVGVRVGLEKPQPDDAWLFDTVRVSVPQRPELGVQVFSNTSAELGPDVASVELYPDAGLSTAAGTPEPSKPLEAGSQHQQQQQQLQEQREASGKSRSQQQWDWVVKLRVSPDSGAKQTGRLFLALYGDSGHSRDICLNAEQNDDRQKQQLEEEQVKRSLQELTPGAECEFRMVTEPLGRLWKLRLSVHHQDSWDNFSVSSLQLSRLVTTKEGDEEAADKQEFHVELNVKLGRTSDAVLAKEKPLEVDRTLKLYEIEMKVSQVFGASSDTEFFVDVGGSSGNSGRRFLLHDRERSLWFSEGALRRFQIEAVDLGSPKVLFVGHDKPGRAGVGTCFDWVSVRESSAETKLVFPCGRWFDSAFDQVSVERELSACETVHASEGEFDFNGGQVVLTLCSDACSDPYKGPVHVTAVGAKGQSGGLTQPSIEIQPGGLAEFAVDFSQGTTGRVQLLRLQLSSPSMDVTLSGLCIREAGNWLASAISTNNPAIRRWSALEFGAASEAGASCHDVPLDKGLRLVNYIIGIRTAAGDDGNARPPKRFTVDIQGRHGRTEGRPLGPRALIREDFGHRPNGMDTFLVPAVYVGPPLRLTIALADRDAAADDSDSPDSISWPIAEVILREGEFNPYEFRFLTNNARLTPSSTSLQLREPQRVPAAAGLTGLPEFPRTTGRFNVVLHIGSVGWTGEPANCRLRLSASGTMSLADTQPQELLPAGDRGLASYSVHRFLLDFGDIGELTRLRLDLTGVPEARLEVTKLRLSDAGSSAEFFLPVNRVLACGESVELAACRPGVPQPRTLAYQISLRLGAGRNGAGCGDLAANSLSLKLHGDMGESGAMPLPPSQQPLSPGQTLHARLNCLSVGQLTGLTIGHDFPGRGQGVYIDHATVSYADPSVATVYFPAKRWLDAGWGDGFTQARLGPPALDAVACSEVDWLLEVATDEADALLGLATAGRLRVRLQHQRDADGRAFVTEVGKDADDGARDSADEEDEDEDETMLLTPVTEPESQAGDQRRCLLTFRRRLPLAKPTSPSVALVSADSDIGEIASLTLLLDGASSSSSEQDQPSSIRVSSVSLAETRYSRWCAKFLPAGDGQPAALTSQLKLTSPTSSSVENFQSLVEAPARGTVSFGRWRLETWSRPADSEKLPPGWIEFVSSGDVSSGRLPLTGLAGQGKEEFLVSFDPVSVHEVFKIRLGLDEAAESSGGGIWLLDKIRLQDLDTMDTFAASINQQQAASITPGDCIEVQADWPGAHLLDTVDYEVSLKVGAGSNSGTAGGVYVNLHSADGVKSTGERLLARGLTPGQEVTRRFRSLRLLPDIGRLSLRCDAGGPGNGVFVERLTVRQLAVNGSDSSVGGGGSRKLKFPVHRGLDEGDEDGRLSLELFPAAESTEASN